MLTKNEITALNLSPTKKDFVQIWNELLEVAGRLSERWDPTSTNESDPGIVILKALTGIADKLNYNIDKNTLEAFMPTAAQEDSMRKLCDMLGYNVKYYRSAETTVRIKYYNSDPSADEKEALQYGLIIPKFTAITNGDQDINYFTTNQTPLFISSTMPTTEYIPCMEGQIVKCESANDNNVITVSHITENNRFYLPEHQIAENGIFVYNVVAYQTNGNAQDGEQWEKVDNLNIQARGSRVFKFGYDSYEGRPYLEFPEDYSELINDGLFIYYARTSGASGNISAKTLTQLELPSGDGWDSVSAESFSVENDFSATSGANIETIGQAYNNFKKTIGTFETLVTCRDYMNKIYTMTDSGTGKYLVSNALVTDIRTDLNRAITICSCDDAGIFYKETPLISISSNDQQNSTSTIYDEVADPVSVHNQSTVNKPVFNPNRRVNGSNWFLGSADGMPIERANLMELGNSSSFNQSADGDVFADTDGYWHIYQPKGFRTWDCKTVLKVESTTSTITKIVVNNTNNSAISEQPAIDHFDLVLYPFKSYSQIKNSVRDIQAAYDKSFEYDSSASVKNELEQLDVKTIAHNIISPRKNDIVSINNYLRLNAIVGTAAKVTVEEGKLLVEKIKIAIANAFNMRELDFGDEIPFDSILSVIENADARISVVSLTEPAIYTTFSVFEGFDSSNNPILREYAVASDWLTESYANSSDRFEYVNEVIGEEDINEKYTHTFNTTEAKKIYNRLAVRNILAGRVPLFKYNSTFKASFSDGAYRVTDSITEDEVKALPEKARNILEDSNESFAIYSVDDVIYTGRQLSEAERVYTKTYTPEDYVDNIISKNADDDTNYTEIETECQVLLDKDVDDKDTACISNVTLSDGEYIKFRAPNFITNKTYPAYVNYNLKLANSSSKTREDAIAAEAVTLSSLLTGDKAQNEQLRNAVFSHFEKANSELIKKFTLIQTVYGKKSEEEVKSSDITIKIDNSSSDYAETPSQILGKSGFVKLVSGKATLKSVNTDYTLSTDIKIPDIYLVTSSGSTLASTVSITKPDNANITSYLTSVGGFSAIKDVVDSCLVKLDTLPEFDWTVSYDFVYVPFELETLKEWENFVSNSLGFTPVKEYGTALWRIYQGSYQIGKYVLSDGISMLMPFTGSHFGLLSSNRLESIYVATNLGEDAVPNYVSNNEEYQLRSGEYLYIEYTPSTTTEDSSTQTQEPIKEVFGAGTIIKPSGFDGFGLLDAKASGKSAVKTVTFGTKDGAESSTDVELFSLGASEQIAIRELSKVVINSTTLSDSPVINFYKNFNDCAELEEAKYDGTGKRINNSYTLKDGEYVFYTDQNMTEFAYYGSGTEITLEGRRDFVIPKCELIDISTIFDDGIQAIPWKSKTFAKNDSVSFQEFQYITLGPNDTLQSLFLCERNSSTDAYMPLSKDWQKCVDATYTTAGSTKLDRLQKINIDGNDGNGWEVCSLLELNVSPNSTQTLRTTDKIKTSITLYKMPASGLEEREKVLTLEVKEANPPISFKTNLSCVSSTSSLSISDIYSNTDVKSFEIKVLSEQPPAIIKTKRNKLVPCADSGATDIASWAAEATKTFNTKSYNEIWTRVPLYYIAKIDNADDTAEPYDNALKLSVSTLPNTYGIFSIYLKYGNTESATSGISTNTWIDILPGTPDNIVTVLNDTNSKCENGRLMLKPGINCICVNKTCDLFIKTSLSSTDENYEKLSTSALYFDDLRLVDCHPIEYVENGEKKLQKTQGINLDQIGYLDAAEINSLNEFDMQVRKNLRNEYIENTISELDERAKLEAKNSEQANTYIKENKSKLQELVNFVDIAKTELTYLLDNNSSDSIDDMFKIYNEIRKDLDQEEELKAKLTDSNNIIDLEKQLVDMLSNLEDGESKKLALLGELDTLDYVATSKANTFSKETLSKGAILDDFDSINSSDTQLINDLKLFSLKEVNAEYATKLEELVTMVDDVSNDEAKNTLLGILEDINVAKHNKLITQTQALVSMKQETLESLLGDIVDQANGDENNSYNVDYIELRTKLTNLRQYIIGKEIADMLSEINLISNSVMENSDKYSELIKITNSLSALLDSEGEPVSGNYASLVASVDELIEDVNTKIESKIVNRDETIVSSIEDLYSEATTIYIEQLSSLLSDLKGALDELESSYNKAIESLDSSDTIQIILSKLDSYNTVRDTQIGTIEAFGAKSIKDDYFTLPYGILAVLSVWPTYMKRAYLIGVACLYRDIRKAINNPSTVDVLTIDNNFYAGGELRPVLVNAANLTSFQQLFEQAKTIVSASTQSSRRAALINSLGALITPSKALSDALRDVSIDADTYADRNYALQQLIKTFEKATTIVEKQRILNELIDELDSAITIDTKLVEICAKLLCPSILLFPVCNISSVEDTFYDDLRTYINSKKLSLSKMASGFDTELSKTLDNCTCAYEAIESLNKAIDTDNLDLNSIISLEEVSKTNKTFLTNYYLDKLISEIKPALDIKRQIELIKSSKLFDLLQKDLVVAWEDKFEWQQDKETKHRFNWLDSSGKYYQKKISNNWVAYPVYGTSAEQAEWLKADGNYTESISGIDLWRTHAGNITAVDAKRAYESGKWLNATNNEIKVKDDRGWLISDEEYFTISDKQLEALLTTSNKTGLLDRVESLGQLNYMSEEAKAAHNILWLETQLLNEIRELDRNREFYYNVPVEANVAINFNEGDAKLNTLMNPAVNYDINNVNNNFVISKIDINYLTSGIQIARSSKLS